jgi:hypothetical protein
VRGGNLLVIQVKYARPALIKQIHHVISHKSFRKRGKGTRKRRESELIIDGLGAKTEETKFRRRFKMIGEK